MSFQWHEVHAHLIEQAARAEFQRQFRNMRSRHGPLSGFSDPGALLGFLHGEVGTAEQKNEVLRALVLEAQIAGGHGQAGIGLVLLALWPGLDAVRKRLLRYFRNDPDYLAAELTGRLAQAVASANLDRVTRIAATLLRNIERDLKREVVRRAREVGISRLDDCQGVATQPVHPGCDVLATLRDHIGSDAELVMAVVILGFTQKEAAHALGLSHDAARKRYQRAVSRLSARILPVEL